MQGPRGGPRFFYFDVTNVFQKFQDHSRSQTFIILHLKNSSSLRGAKISKSLFFESDARFKLLVENVVSDIIFHKESESGVGFEEK